MSKAAYTVLVIDDNPQMLKVYATGLPLIGPFTVFTAENGAEGLERYYETRPDCVVIDVRMPELDGYQVTRALRGDPDSADTPLIILTAMVQERDRYDGIASGIDSYLLKPVKPSELADAILFACEMHPTQREEVQRALAEDPHYPHA